MRTWDRIGNRDTCGQCGKLLLRGDPVLVITIESLKRRKLRCEECAGLKAPPDLPALIEKVPRTAPMQPIARAIPKDYSARLLGERE